MPSPLHLVASDMDGTLLAPSGTLSERTLAVVRDLRARGILFAIATGRPAPALQQHVDRLGLAIPCITFNGSSLMHMRPLLPPTPLWEHSLSGDLAEKAIRFAVGAGCCVSYSMRDRAVALVTSAAHRAFLTRYETLEGVTQGVCEEQADMLSLPAPALKIVALTDTPDETAAAARAALANEALHVISAEMHIEFMPLGNNKAVALARLCEVLRLPMSSCAAFGDGDNDAEMLAAVGLGVAMANGRAKAKAAAAEVSGLSNADDAVAQRCDELIAAGRLQPIRQ